MDHSKRAVSIFNKHAQAYNDKFMDTSSYHKALDVFCAGISNEGARILDVACGPGNLTKYVLEQRPSFQVLGIDLAENMIALAKVNNPKGEFRIMDGRNINELQGKYNGIICGFGFPYFSKKEAIEFIHDAAQLLTGGGMLYLSTMEDGYEKSGMQTNNAGEQLFMYYHEAGYLQEALGQGMMRIMDIQRIPYKDARGEFMDMVIVAKKIES